MLIYSDVKKIVTIENTGMKNETTTENLHLQTIHSNNICNGRYNKTVTFHFLPAELFQPFSFPPSSISISPVSQLDNKSAERSSFHKETWKLFGRDGRAVHNHDYTILKIINFKAQFNGK